MRKKRVREREGERELENKTGYFLSDLRLIELLLLYLLF